MQVSPDICFILPTHGNLDYAKRCADSFKRHTANHSHKVIVIDDASPDWLEHPRSTWPEDVLRIHHPKHAGLTRSWNEGLKLAKSMGATYTICGNSDLLFSPDWFTHIKTALEVVDLVGPVTNAPGHCPHQNVARLGVEMLDDSEWSIASVASACATRGLVRLVERVNGFCMIAKTKTWWSCPFDQQHVFNPRYTLVGNEDELQKRWRAAGLKIGYAQRSYVFHYRSLSRPWALSKPEGAGAYRPAEAKNDLHMHAL